MKSLFWQNLFKIERYLNLNEVGMAQILKVTPERYRLIKKFQKMPRISEIDHLCEHFGISIDNLFEKEIDFFLLRSRFYGNNYELPEKYNFGKYSKSRTIINCLHYISRKFGEEAKYSILRSLQIDPCFFDRYDREMNIFVLSDLCDLARNMGFRDNDFVNLGRASYQVNRNTKLGKRLSSHSTILSLFEDICQNLSTSFDENFHYQIHKSTMNTIFIRSIPTGWAQSGLSTKKVGSPTICLTKLGVFETFPNYIGIFNAKATKTKCIYQGDSCLEYQVNF